MRYEEPTGSTVPPGFAEDVHRLLFSRWNQAALATPEGEMAVREVVFRRYELALRHTIPWLTRAIPLSEAHVVEIGCGTGSSTLALAGAARHVTGIDMDALSLEVARARCRAYGQSNVSIHHGTAGEALGLLGVTEPAPSVFVLYAVLEHLTVAERLEVLSLLWSALPPGGALVVVETPNRLVYFDTHTSQCEFFHLLPPELALRYYDKSPRESFRASVESALATGGPEAAEQRWARLGTGVGYHEFEIALAEPLDELLVADGFEAEMATLFGPTLEEHLLCRYFLDLPVNKPMAFSRAVLNFILRKPLDASERASASARSLQRRRELAGTCPRLVPPSRERV